MKERPILFSAPMVRAILAGTKTQTRRVVKPQPEMMGGGGAWRWDGRKGSFRGSMGTHIEAFPKGAGGYCPYGAPGDQLWVRETFHNYWNDENTFINRYRADEEFPDHLKHWRWKPSIHMPRIVSRIDLMITGVRTERLQDISRADVIAEGIPARDVRALEWPSEPYAELWEGINGPGSWKANPWVWVVEFKVLKPSPTQAGIHGV